MKAPLATAAALAGALVPGGAPTPTLVITNLPHFRVPADQGLQLFTALRRNEVPSEVLVFAHEGHFVLKALNSKPWHETVFGWIQKYIGD